MCIPRYKALCLTLTEDLPEFCVLVAFAFTQEFETADAVFLFVITVLLSVLSFVEQVMDYRSGKPEQPWWCAGEHVNAHLRGRPGANCGVLARQT